MGHDLDPVKLAEEELMKIAQLDLLVTDEEKRAIEKILEEMKKYKVKLDEALEDHIITPQEKMNLFASKMEIVRNTVKMLNTDFKVTKDEEALLEGLHNLIAKLTKEERKFQ